MKEQKNIDRLFQEKFKDFESHPSDRVWNNILAAQKENEDKKIIPLWWKLGGIAAALLLLFGIGSLFIKTSNQENTQIVDVSTTNDENNISQENTTTTQTTLEKLKSNEKSNKLVTSNNTQTTPSIKSSTTQNITENTGLASRGNKNTNESVSQNTSNKANFTITNQSTEGITYQTDSTPQETYNVSGSLNATTSGAVNNVSLQENTNAIAQATILTEDNTNNSKNLVEEAQKIETLQEDKLAQVTDKTVINRWDVGAVAAPVYYGDFGGSGLDKQFADNDKSGDVNLSYGVQVSYAISPKFKIRTGVSNVDLSYNTNEISFSTNGLGRSVRGISFTDNAKTLAILDNPAAQNNFAADNVIPRIGVTSNGSLQQQLSYVEVPLEAIYVISDKRVGLSLIGGVSTLFLNENDVILKSSQLTTSLGTANGVNEVSFTTNIGVGLDYKVTKKIIFNIEPSLKYQLNSFDNTVVDFQPYYIGVYTGVSYKF